MQSCSQLQCQPVHHQQYHEGEQSKLQSDYSDMSQENGNGEIISVRITSSVAVERGKGRKLHNTLTSRSGAENNASVDTVSNDPNNVAASEKIISTDIPPDLAGANIEFIKQLNAKKEARGLHNFEQVHPFHFNSNNQFNDSATEESVKSHVEVPFPNISRQNSFKENIPLGRSISFLSKDLVNYDQAFTKPSENIRNSPKLTTVSFNIVHETPTISSINVPNESFSKIPVLPQTYFNEGPTVYSEPAKIYSEPAKVYSEPAKVYGEPAKIYGEPAKVYGEPAKIYGERAKVYSEPAKVYSEPAKFYSEPASLHLEENQSEQRKALSSLSTPINTTPSIKVKSPVQNKEHFPEKNYEIDEKLSVLTDGKSHGVQETTTENGKVGYVVEGRQYRKYRVEERTPDGFIVGEYGVVRNEDGALRGVRYTADGEASPRLIYDALMKFLQLK